MSKGHLSAPLKWVKEQFAKLNADVTALNSDLEKVLPFDYTKVSTELTLETGKVTTYTTTKSGYYQVTASTNSTAISPACYIMYGDVMLTYAQAPNTTWTYATTDWIYIKANTTIKVIAVFNSIGKLNYAPPISEV